MLCKSGVCQRSLCTSRNTIIAGILMMLSILMFSPEMNKILDGDCKHCKVFNGGQLTNWSASHFVAYFLAGLVCPNQFKLIFTMGVIWEIIELYIEYDYKVKQTPIICKTIRGGGIGDSEESTCDGDKITSKEFWDTYFGRKKTKHLYYCSNGYLGQSLDIICNTSGYLLGAYIHNNFISN